MNQLILVYGLSGSGKSTSARILEDNGIRVIYNWPPTLLHELLRAPKKDEELETLAVFPDTSSSANIAQTVNGVIALLERKCTVSEIFLECSDETLLNRYKESRRPHPLSASEGLLDAILTERSLLVPLRRRAQHLISTDSFDKTQLKSDLLKCFDAEMARNLSVTFLSFGFKYGVPPEVDLCFDVRFLENPFFVKELRELSGCDEAVKAFVMGKSETKLFLEQLNQMLALLLPWYFREGKSYLTVGIGCTGGRHRSVVIADALLNSTFNEKVSFASMHRDVLRRPSA